MNLTKLMTRSFEPRTKNVGLNDADMECIQAHLFPAVSPPPPPSVFRGGD